MKAKGGIDPGNCPMCAAAQELGVPELIPEPRFAIPVIRVTCTSKTSAEPQDPPGAKIYVLTLTAKQYSGLVGNFDSIRELYDWPPTHEVKPNQADIILKCADGDWKRYEWQPPKRRCWQEAKNPEMFSLIKRLWGNAANRPTDEQLEAAIARPADRRWVEIDLEKVTSAWAEVRSIQRGETPERHRQQPAETAGANTGADDLAGALDDLDNIDELLGDDSVAGTGSGEPDLVGLGEFDAGTTSNPGSNGKAAAASEPGPDDTVQEAAGDPPGDEGELFGDPEPAAGAKTPVKAAAGAKIPVKAAAGAKIPVKAAAGAKIPVKAAAAPADEDDVGSFDKIMDDL